MKKLFGILVALALLIGSYLPASAEKFTFKSGGADRTVYLRVYDSASSTGARLTTLAFNTASLDCDYTRAGAAATGITLATQTATGAHSDGGFVHIGKGLYRLDLPDAATAAGVNSVHIDCDGATGMVPAAVDIELVAYDPQVATNLGLSALPTANPAASGGLPTVGTGSGQINPSSGNVTAGSVATGGITSGSFAAGAIDAAAIATDAIGAAEIAASAIGSSELATDAITAAEIAADAIGADELATDAIGAAEIAADAIGASEIATDAITATEIAANAIGSSEIADNTIDAGAISDGAVAAEVWDAARSSYLTAGSFGQAHQIIRSGTAQAGAASTITLDASASATDDLYNQSAITILSGTGAGQTRQISDYVGSTKVATVNATWATTPDNTSVFLITANGVNPASSGLTASDVWTHGTRNLTAGAITSSTFAAGAIDAAAIATDAIGAAELATDAITAAKIAADAIGASEIAADAIGASEIAADAITATEIAANAIGASELATDAIGASEIAADAITSAKIAADAIGASELATDAIGAAEIAAGAFTPDAYLTAGTISAESGTTLSLSGGVAANDQFNTGFKIVVYAAADGSIEASTCIDDTINGSPDQVITREDITAFIAVSDPFDILPDAGCPALRPTTAARTLDVTATGEAGLDFSNTAGTIDAAEIATGAITSAKFAAGAIDAAAIATDAIGANEIAADAIGATEIAADAIGAAEIAASAIGASEIADGSVASEVWDAARSSYTVAGSFGQAHQIIRSATAQAGGAASITLDASASATDDLYNNTQVWIVSGTGAGQSRQISDYVGSTKVATVNANWATTPDNTSVFLILPLGITPQTSGLTAADVWTHSTRNLTAGAITSSTFAAGAIDAAAIATDAIGAAELAADAIGASEIATDAITAAKIAADAIGASEIASDAIGSAELAADAITSSEIATDAIGALEIATDAITATEIAADAIGASELATDAIGAAELAASAIGAAEIADGAVASEVWDSLRSSYTVAGSFGQAHQIIRSATAQAGSASSITLDASASATDDLYNNTQVWIVSGTGAGQSRQISDYVGSTKVATVNANWVTNPDNTSVFLILSLGITPQTSGLSASDVWAHGSRTLTAGAITSSTFAADAIDAAAIAPDAIGASEIAASAIGAAEIATDAITSAKIATDAIGADELAASAIGASEIATDAIGADELAADAVGASELATDAIGAAEIAANAITAAEIAADAIGASEVGLPTGTVQAGAAGCNSGTNSALTFATSRTETVTNFWTNTQLITITSGALSGQTRQISGYTWTGAVGCLTVATAFTGIPADGVTFLIVNK